MRELTSAYPLTPESHPLRTMLLLFGFIMVGSAVGTGLGAVLIASAMKATGGSLNSITDLLANPATTPNGWWWLMLFQSISHVSTFLLPALVYWIAIDKRRFGQFNGQPVGAVAGWGLVVLVTLASMPVNGLLIEWNQALKLPDTLAPLERWMHEKEDLAGKLTKFLTTISTTPQLLMALLTIAVLPGIGEEVLFRGVLQRKFIVWTGNIHVGIWVAAALFSAIHVQFYGFLPRMLLGALFGYLYVWSGNLWVPILAHFVNNGFQVLMIFLFQRRLTTIDVDSTESVPLTAALLGTLVSAGALILFKRMNKKGVMNDASA